MFPGRYFGGRYFAARYFAKIGADPTGSIFGRRSVGTRTGSRTARRNWWGI